MSPSGPRLSEHAQALLKAASKQNDGQILLLAIMGGRIIQAGSQSFGGQGGRENAKWEHALKELYDYSLVVSRSPKGEVYELTHSGWAMADKIQE